MAISGVLRSLIVLAVGAMLVMSGCASLLTDNHKWIELKSDEPGTIFYVDNKQLHGNETVVNQRIDHEIRAFKQGCRDETEELVSETSPAFFFNAIWVILGVISAVSARSEIPAIVGGGITVQWMLNDIMHEEESVINKSVIRLTPDCGRKKKAAAPKRRCAKHIPDCPAGQKATHTKPKKRCPAHIPDCPK